MQTEESGSGDPWVWRQVNKEQEMHGRGVGGEQKIHKVNKEEEATQG